MHSTTKGKKRKGEGERARAKNFCKKGLTYCHPYAILKMPTGKRHRKELIYTARKTTTSNEVKDRWKAANYSRVNIYLPKADAEAYKAKCAEKQIALSDVPKTAIYSFLRDE